MIEDVRKYWNENLHDIAITSFLPGSAEFFKELGSYRYKKLNYLVDLLDFESYRGKYLLEIGCGVGIDLVRFARAGAKVVGVDISEKAIGLAQKYFSLENLQVDLHVMNGEALEFTNNTFDVVYVHGVLPYTTHPEKMISEVYRVLKPGGEAILMVYNKFSWLNLLTKLTNVPLEHVDAPVYRKYSTSEFKKLLKPFKQYQIIFERFPSKTQLHNNWKGKVYNDFFVRAFNFIPRVMIKPFGWHLVSFAVKEK
ncbi:MAG: class I SAM-dependent methyltransferase [Anaerolineales bacterium]|nr:class I SAM-dependent methyltransferase [Anaerolineales bacterium]